MLNIFFGDMPEAIYNTAVYFKNVYEEAWITAPLAKEMIFDIDKSIVLDGAVIDSPVLGKISPLNLSGGAMASVIRENMAAFNAAYLQSNICDKITGIMEKISLTKPQ